MTLGNPRRLPQCAGTALAVLAFFVWASGCERRPVEHLIDGPIMGTTYSVKLVGAFEAEELLAFEAGIEAALNEVNALMSTYDPESELSRFNALDSTAAFQVSPPTAEVVRIAQTVSEQTGGAFDITVGPIVNAYGFGPEERTEAPTEEELAALYDRVGYEKLTLEEGTLRKAQPDLYVDLSAVAKGYAVDAVAAYLEQQGVNDYLVEVGGEMRARGLNGSGDVWRVGIEKPMAEGRAMQRAVSLADAALATSGDYRNFYLVDGEPVSHTIDPRTGRPARHPLTAVSVVHEACAWADAYATALMVLGPEAGPAFAEQHDLAALFLVREGDELREILSPAMDALLHGVEAAPANG